MQFYHTFPFIDFILFYSPFIETRLQRAAKSKKRKKEEEAVESDVVIILLNDGSSRTY